MKIALRRPPKDENGNVRDFTPVPEGKYRALIDTVEEVEDQWGGLRINFIFQGGDQDGKSRELRVFPNGEAIRSLFESVGLDSESEDAEFNDTDLVGSEVNIFLEITRKAGKEYNKVKKFTAVPVKKAK